MLKLYVAFLLLLTASCGSGCSDAAVETLKRIDAAVYTAATDQLTKEKYIALVADARGKVEAMQGCLPAEELYGERNEHLRNALVYYDDAADDWGSGSNPRLKEYWKLAHEELSKIK